MPSTGRQAIRAPRHAETVGEEIHLEHQWLLAARANPEQFRYFYAKYAGRLRSYIRQRIRDPELADDLLATVFAKALDRLEAFRWRGVGLGAWLYRIAANEICDHVRRERRLAFVGCECLDESLADPRAGQLSGLVQVEVGAALRRCLRRLAERDRDIFRLHYWEGLKTREVAERLRMSENTVKTRLLRGRARLRAMLEDGSPPAGRDELHELQLAKTPAAS